VNPRKVEWKDGDMWRQTKVKLCISRSGNYTFEHEAKRYVFKNLFEGTEVVVLEGNKWVKAGRITHFGEIFLDLGESYSEMIERQNRGKTSEQLIAELRNFMHPECRPLDRAEKTINSLKNAEWKGF
jgi:hypothetical protein